MQPLRIAIAQERIDDPGRRLASTLWPEEIDNRDWSRGASLAYLQDLASHWQERFEWREWEARLNELPNLTCDVGGLSIHFVHVRSRAERSVPLLLTHGWPSSVLEYLRIVPLLTGQGFDLVIPSLPRYGLSSASRRPGLSIYEIARLWHTLMTDVLGYRRFGAQGGDWGAYCSSKLAHLFPESGSGST